MKLHSLYQSAVRFLREEEGISSVEYALLLAFVGAGVALAAAALGDAVTTEMDEAADEISNSVP